MPGSGSSKCQGAQRSQLLPSLKSGPHCAIPGGGKANTLGGLIVNGVTQVAAHTVSCPRTCRIWCARFWGSMLCLQPVVGSVTLCASCEKSLSRNALPSLGGLSAAKLFKSAGGRRAGPVRAEGGVLPQGRPAGRGRKLLSRRSRRRAGPAKAAAWGATSLAALCSRPEARPLTLADEDVELLQVEQHTLRRARGQHAQHHRRRVAVKGVVLQAVLRVEGVAVGPAAGGGTRVTCGRHALRAQR